MLGDISVADEIYIVCGYTDMRRSIDGLCGIVQEKLHMDPRRGALYLFCGRRCDRIKALLWEGDGFLLLYKRMEAKGRFRWPRNSQEAKAISWQQFDWLMSGLEVEQPKAFRPPENTGSAPEPEAEETVVREHTRKAKSTHAERFKGVPVKEEVIPLSEGQKQCTDCGTQMEVIGRGGVRQEFRFTPAKGEVVNIYRGTAKYPVCSEAPVMEKVVSFVKAPVPEARIPHSYASASAVAWTMYQKYANSLPLYRQEQDWKQIGIPLNRATLANWILYCAGNYFSPLYDYFHRELIKRQFLMADETRVQVLREPGRNAETDSFMWLFRSGEDGLAPILLYKYTQTRAGFNAADFRKGFRGYLETDCYQGYNSLPEGKRCCWAHLRRYFIEAVSRGKELDYSNPAAQGVQYCNKLFEHERQSREKGHTHEQRKEYRLKKEMPMLNVFWEWVSEQSPKKGTRFEKAVNYAQNHKAGFMAYLEDGRCSFSNNLSENAIRPFTVGRRNWLFSDPPKGADASAIVYPMVEMAKAHNRNIFKYLRHLLEHLPGTRMTDSELSRLAPWDPEIISKCSGAM